MAQNLVGYRNSILGDYVRPYMFQLDIPQIGGNSAEGIQNVSALARSTTLPSYELKNETIAYQGLTLNVASVAQFAGTFDVTFLADHTHQLYRLLLEWQAAAYEPGHMYSASPNSYKVDNVKAYQLDRKSKRVLGYFFGGLYPKSVKGWAVAQENTKPAEFSVTFQYDFFDIVSGAALDNHTITSITDHQGIDNNPIDLASDALVIDGATGGQAVKVPGTVPLAGNQQ